MDGEILCVFEESEIVVELGIVFVEIGDLCDLEIVVDFLFVDVVWIDFGYKVLIKDWGGDVVLMGEVIWIEFYVFIKVFVFGIEE